MGINRKAEAMKSFFASRDKRLIIILAVIVLLYFSAGARANDQPKPANGKAVQTVAEKKPAKKTEENKPPAAGQKKEEVTITATADDLQAADIFVGQIINGSIINPRCFDRASLLDSLPESKAAAKADKEKNEGKYWILRAYASTRMEREIQEFSRDAKNKAAFLCVREKLLPLLRKQPAYKDKTDEDLIAGFDVTDEIIEYFAERNSERQKNDGNALEFSGGK